MISANEIALSRLSHTGIVVPGVDTATGNPLTASSLKPVSEMSATAGFYYVPSENEVVVDRAGAILSGWNFGSATVCVEANNVTIKDSTFQAGATGWYSIQQGTSASGTTIENDTFNGGSASDPLPLVAFIDGQNSMSILDNSFLNAPGNAINIESGTVEGNYISGGGYSSNGKHPDLIWVPATTGPLTITNNFINATWAPGATAVNNGETTYALQLTPAFGKISNVRVSNNIIFWAEPIQFTLPAALTATAMST